MNIYIEWIVIFALIFTYLIGKLWIRRSRKKALKKYKKEEDMSGDLHNGKTNKGGVFNTRTDGGADKGTDAVISNSIRHDQFERRELLPQTDVSDVGEDSSGTGKDSSSIRRRLFGRRKRK